MNPDQLFEYLIATDQIDDVLGTKKEIIFYLNGTIKEKIKYYLKKKKTKLLSLWIGQK